MDQLFYFKSIMTTFFPEGLNPIEISMRKETELSAADLQLVIACLTSQSLYMRAMDPATQIPRILHSLIVRSTLTCRKQLCHKDEV